MSEILNDLKKDISNINKSVASIVGTSKLSVDDATRLNNNLSPALSEIDMMLSHRNATTPQAKNVFMDLLDYTLNFKKDIEGVFEQKVKLNLHIIKILYLTLTSII